MTQFSVRTIFYDAEGQEIKVKIHGSDDLVEIEPMAAYFRTFPIDVAMPPTEQSAFAS